MNILQLNFERGWRGGERQTLLCMQQFRAAGHQVALLARAGGELAQRARDQGFMVHECGNVIGVAAYLLRKGSSYDVLHAQTANMLTWLALLKRLLRAPLVFTRRTAFPVPARREARTAWKWRKVDAMVAISQAAAQEPQRLGVDTLVIPSAIQPRPLDADRLNQFSVAFQLEGKRVLATAAALTSEKDPCTLIRAVHLLKQRRDDFVFLHLGAGGDSEPEARALVRELGLEDHYLFAGFQQGVEDFYRLMDGFVLSSRHEALGTSVLDAFQYGVPVVATDTGGLREIVAQERGLLCPVGDHKAMADAMDRILSDRVLRARIVEAARDYVLREHDATVMSQRYLALYESLQDGNTEPAKDAGAA